MKLRYEYRLKKIANLANMSGGIILEIGFALLPNPLLRGKVIGVDIILPKNKPSNYERMVKADVSKKLPFRNNSVDTIVLGGVIEHLENPINSLREMNRVLKPGGVLLIEAPNPYYLPVILADFTMSQKHYFKDTHVSLDPRRIMLKNLWHTGFKLNKIISCGINLTPYFTIPTPQHIAQDIIFVAEKGTPTNEPLYSLIRDMRKTGYERIKARTRGTT